MKNSFLFCLVTVLALPLLLGCAPEKEADAGSSSTAASQPVAATAPAGIPDAARPQVEEQMKRAQEEAKRAEQDAAARNAAQGAK